MSYVDGFVIPVPHDKKDAYREMAQKALPLFKSYGATASSNAGGPTFPTAKSPISRRRCRQGPKRMSFFRG